MVEEEETAAVHDNQNMGEPAVGREPEGVCLHVLLCFSCMFCHSNILYGIYHSVTDSPLCVVDPPQDLGCTIQLGSGSNV